MRCSCEGRAYLGGHVYFRFVEKFFSCSSTGRPSRSSAGRSSDVETMRSGQGWIEAAEDVRRSGG